MRILWIVNVPIINSQTNPLIKKSFSAGWVTSLLDRMRGIIENDITIAFADASVKGVFSFNENGLTYYAFPRGSGIIGQNRLQKDLLEILSNVKPDIVHVFGTEFYHSNQIAKIFDVNKIVYHIQGLVGSVSEHYYSGLPSIVVYGFTFRDIIKLDNIFMQKQKFKLRGFKEIQTIKRAVHVMGRTSWDYACIKQLNPRIKYTQCNEMMREGFYEAHWDINKCSKNVVFMSQGNYPIKGLHSALKAISILKKEYPSIKLVTTGQANTYRSSWLFGFTRQDLYTLYIKWLIRKYDLSKNIEFIGKLDEREIIDTFLDARVFILPSYIENSSNSLSEAMLLGVPIVCSFVGGTPDLVRHEREALMYQSDSSTMLAYNIDRVLKNDDLAVELSINAKTRARDMFNREEITAATLKVYNSIFSDATQ